MGAALQNLANQMPSSLARREAGRVDRVLAEWNRGAAVRTTLKRAEDLAAFGALAFRERDARLAGVRLLALSLHDATAAVAAWDRAMHRAGLAFDTRDRRIANIRTFVRVAHDCGECRWTLPGTRDVADVPTAAEVEHAIAELERKRRRRDLAIVLLAYDATLAVSEIVALRVRDVDFGDGSITTTRRRVSLTPRTIAAVRDAIEDEADGPLFSSARGGDLSPMSAWRIFRSLGLGSPDCVRRAGIEAPG